MEFFAKKMFCFLQHYFLIHQLEQKLSKMKEDPFYLVEDILKTWVLLMLF